ncbi:MAG: nucleoside deaminase [Phycisphaerales bacterium]|nr:MAG: nucleoside deaminase [Phycisphaerales bacterium]
MCEVTIRLPGWVERFVDESPEVFLSVEDRMRFVIALARQNVQHKTGGPFGAAVFDDAGRLKVPGVNLVVSANCSVAHAEIVAVTLAQIALGRYDIGNGGTADYELVSSAEPCAMCFGAIPWSGVSRLVCGAREADARAVGFDEGAKVSDWVAALYGRDIEVLRDVLREEAAAALREYADAGGPFYNAGPPRQ